MCDGDLRDAERRGEIACPRYEGGGEGTVLVIFVVGCAGDRSCKWFWANST